MQSSTELDILRTSRHPVSQAVCKHTPRMRTSAAAQRPLRTQTPIVSPQFWLGAGLEVLPEMRPGSQYCEHESNLQGHTVRKCVRNACVVG